MASKYDFLSGMKKGDSHKFYCRWSASNYRNKREAIRVTAKRKHNGSKWKVDKKTDEKGKFFLVERVL